MIIQNPLKIKNKSFNEGTYFLKHVGQELNDQCERGKCSQVQKTNPGNEKKIGPYSARTDMADYHHTSQAKFIHTS